MLVVQTIKKQQAWVGH